MVASKDSGEAYRIATAGSSFFMAVSTTAPVQLLRRSLPRKLVGEKMRFNFLYISSLDSLL
ncbi:hypothetical protein R6Q59_018249 [Mikania micrantha]